MKDKDYKKEYFDLVGISEYSKVVNKTYRSTSNEATWYYDTREKLYYLVNILGNELSEKFDIVYKEAPNGQNGRGRIDFKEYVLAGFVPKGNNIEDDLFMKVAFSSLDKNPVFEINLDINAKNKNGRFKQERKDIFNKKYESWPIDDLFPRDWETLMELIKPSIIDLLETYNDFLSNSLTIMRPILNNNLNQILYGPPGTGKTYYLRNNYFGEFTVQASELTREQYLENIVSQLSWWQIISIVVYDIGAAKVREVYNHELIQIKERLSSSKTIMPTIWGQLQSHTVMECPNVNVSYRSEPLFFFKDNDSKWTIDKELLEQSYPEAIEILNKSKDYKPEIDKSIKNYEFVTFHQSFTYEDFIEGIKPKLEENDGELAYEIKDGVFKSLCLKAKADSENEYAMFIDEINRGNVSAIFGELITLIEKDKRLGEENEMTIKLPYSKTEFGVPNNLYIIGTMNTADRSVEALDTALRRRFSFKEMMPKSELLEKISFSEFNLNEVLETINNRIEALLDRDHTIGHSYFMNIASNDTQALAAVFRDKVIPLLQEYFYHDYEKIALVLGEGFVEIKNNQTVKFAAINGADIPEAVTQFKLNSEVRDIEEAVKQMFV